MTAGSKKFAILDFGLPVLLSDIFIPSCEYTHSIYVDAWNKNEQSGTVENFQRLISYNEIDKKCVSLSNISPPLVVRYVKVGAVVGKVSIIFS